MRELLLELRDHWSGGHPVVSLWLGAERGSEADHAQVAVFLLLMMVPLVVLCLVDGAGLGVFLLKSGV